VATNASNPSYVALQMQPGEIICQVQAVTHDSRVHLDIETDNLDAEVDRLAHLGAVVACVDTGQDWSRAARPPADSRRDLAGGEADRPRLI